MPNITFPSNTKEIIDEIRSEIGRNITIYHTVSGIACSGCGLDPTTGMSIDPFCPICDGDYWLTGTEELTVLAHIRWFDSEQPLWVEGGIIKEGDCKVTITYSDANLNAVKNSEYFLVDSKELYKKNFALKGAQEINRIAVTLLEDKG